MDMSEADVRRKAGVQAKLAKRRAFRDEYFAECAAERAERLLLPDALHIPHSPLQSQHVASASGPNVLTTEEASSTSTLIITTSKEPSLEIAKAKHVLTVDAQSRKRSLESEATAASNLPKTDSNSSIPVISVGAPALAKLGPIRKRPRSNDTDFHSSTASSETVSQVISCPKIAQLGNEEEEPLPDWYLKAKRPGRPTAQEREGWDQLKHLVKLIREVRESKGNSIPHKVREVYFEIDKLRFMDVTPWGLRHAKLLDSDSGLPQIFSYKSASYPNYVKTDACGLYKRWMKKIFDGSNMFRGINNMIKDKTAKGHGPSIDKVFKIDWHFFGQGHLVNGDWFANQLCAVRDGAHGSPQGGISGIEGKGATSISMSGDMYADTDRDELNEVWYSGTVQSKQGETTKTANTKLLIDSEESRLPVRVLRSMHLPKNNPYRPDRGFRYDGLYTVVGHTCIDLDKQHYLFHLVRTAGQDPVRYKGVEKRPTEKEMKSFDREMKMYVKKGIWGK